MSFGCSPSDVLKLLEFSTRVYLAFKDANANSESQVEGLVREFTSFHLCLTELGELMKQYGQPMPFPCKEFEETLKKCEKTLEPYAEQLVDRKMNVKKFIFTIKYMGMEKEIDGLRKQITGHYQALHMCISFLQLRLNLEATKQTQRLLDAVPHRTMGVAGRSYSTNALGSSSTHVPLALSAPDEHPLYTEWVIFDRWLQREDERIAQEAGVVRPLSLGDTSAAAPSGDAETAAILYHLRQQVDDAILIEENREKRTIAEKRSHLSPSDAMKQKVRNMPPAPLRTYTLETDHSENFTRFDQDPMSSSSATIRPDPEASLPSSPHSGGARIDSYFSSPDWTHSPAGSATSRGSDATNRSSVSFSPGSRLSVSLHDMSTACTTPEHVVQHSLQRSLSRTSLATIALGEAALEWKRICRTVEVERTSLKYGSENKQCDVRWRYREDTGISLRAVYHSSQDGKLRTWTEQHFPATGPSIPLTTTHPDGAVSINFPRRSFGRLDKQYIDIKYTLSGYESAEKLQTLLYTNNGADPAELKFDRPVLTISTNKNPNECRGQNLRLWHRSETHLEQNGPVTYDVLVLLFYTNALEDQGHWVEEPHYAFEWISESIYKKDSEKLTLVFSKDPKKWRSHKLFQDRKPSAANDQRRKSSAISDVTPKSPSIFPRKRNDSMEVSELKRSNTIISASSTSAASVTSVKSMNHRGSMASRPGSLNRFGYSELEIKFQNKKDRRAFLDVWKLYVKPLSVSS